MAKSTHLIEKFTVAEDSILCVCAWEGPSKEFRQHQIKSPPTSRKPPADKYKGSEFATNTIVFAD